ncbi:MAG: Precorrin-6A synthase (deacetylating) [uncultured Solirubrobacteraceae bacterium]|uniref:Precorrin-6A synthase (Deacetylating) n=1 Tax=uncultured Solirubrobacteraceae bacterium TaxID=1162706 RepID=A0A6J4RN89_9ACTN|nr:MAG: Precorrin-6A synthase (deacetylating) [uncultured Solirubrobacteraceae bacterium]
MRRLLLIGIGAGDPDHVTVQAVRALNAFDVLFVVTKEGTDDLVALRRHVVDRHRTAADHRTVELADPPRPWRDAPDYPAAVARWREQRVTLWEAAIRDELGEDETGAFLVWGDPSLYESTLAIVQEIAARGTVAFEHEVIPGVSSVHALTARHRVPLNRLGGAVQITPARLLAGGMPEGVDDVVVMIDAEATFATLPPEGIDIYWGAYLGTVDELLVRGPLAEVAGEIVRVREEAAARKGWMFDIYLLRRTG